MHPHDHLFSFFSPGAAARTAAGLAALAVRRPRLFAQLLLAGFRDKRALVRLLRLPVDLDTVRRSPLFDGEWYRRNHPDIVRSGTPPELHYLLNCIPDGRWASPRFSGDAYLELNPEVRASGVNPLVHYEQCGRFLSLPASRPEAFPPDPVFPAGTESLDETLGDVAPRHGRTAVFATFVPDGRLPEKDILYLRALREVCDNVVVAVNAPLFPDEIARLRGLASAVVCRWHGGYDFGSYRIGMEAARRRGWLAPDRCRELVFANGSCFAPLFPFSGMFREMEPRTADFWGVCRNTQCCERPYVQSFFLVFRRPVLDASALDLFFAARPAKVTRTEAISLFEQQLTPFLEDRGFKAGSLVPLLASRFRECNPTTRPLTLIRRYRVPLVKVKVFDGQTVQSPERVLALVRRLNPELAAVVRPGTPPDPPEPVSPAEEARGRAALAARIGERVRAGKPARALFLVSSPAMFPARPLFEAMRLDPAFEARIAVVPDLRWPGRDPVRAMESCERELGSAFPGALLPPLRPDADAVWPDAIADFGADVVCHPSPYDFSFFRYNPSRSAGRDCLPVYVSYSFSTSRYGHEVFGLHNYARFWKVFVECEANAAEYAEHSLLKGANAVTTGYFKMDALATAKPWPRNGGRKRVLVAPHHSVEGGANDTLAFSNFVRYADFFLALPEKRPELDFVFRPHPFLFTVLAHPSKWGRARVDRWIARMKAHPNVRWSDEGDYFPAFVSCDALVHDCGSFLAEWFYTGKPQCYMLKEPSDADAKFAPLGKECLSHCYLAFDEEAIENFLRDVVEGGDDPKAAERDAFRKTIMVNHPHAADAALQAVKDAFGIAR